VTTQSTHLTGLDRVDGEGAAVDSPACLRAQVLVVVAQVPHQIGHLAVPLGPVVGDAGDATQRIVGLGRRGVHLAHDRVLGPVDASQGVHRGAHAGFAKLHADRIELMGRIGQAQFCGVSE
jgi:hypothetical protein